MMTQELVKLLAAYEEMAKNHEKNAKLIEACLDDWGDHPVVQTQLRHIFKTETANAIDKRHAIFEITKRTI